MSLTIVLFSKIGTPSVEPMLIALFVVVSKRAPDYGTRPPREGESAFAPSNKGRARFLIVARDRCADYGAEIVDASKRNRTGAEVGYVNA